MDNNQNHPHPVAEAATVIRAVRIAFVILPSLFCALMFGCAPQSAEKPSASAAPQSAGVVTTPVQGKQAAVDAIDKSNMSPEEKQAMKERMARMSKTP